jgi:type IX secretion system PorP/SprF family membrane protein
MSKKIITIIATVFGLTIGAFAQDIHFSQFNMSPLTLNPSMAGAQHDIQAALNYKSQWASVSSSPYKTFACSYDMVLNRRNSRKGMLGAGINVFSDKAGDGNFSTTQANLSIAYHVRLNGENTLGGGIQAGYLQRSIDYAALKWGNQYDGTAWNSSIAPTEPMGADPSIGMVDFAGGIVWCYDNSANSNSVTGDNDTKFCAGFSVFHVGKPEYGFYADNHKLYMKYVGHANALIGLHNSNMAVVPGIMYAKQGPAQEIYAGTLLRFTLGMDSKYTGFRNGAAISFGGYVRAKDAIAAVVQLDYANYTMGISYDLNTSGLTQASSGRGGIEVALRYVAPNPFVQKRSRSLID